MFICMYVCTYVYTQYRKLHCSHNLPTTEFELFDYVADLLKAVSVTLLFALIVGDDLHSHSTMNKQSLTSSC